ncbi:hypothetical protein Y032_0573g156 [Ancylostoma ceylanicum]|uniref:Reverse transcriptase domain-containing protein n=1 Tax=Ancylostoma ceylanicum TaxID=53326 RepID=A0A016WNT7_9BILA|nr:hypothetical protein Y032_0573g156 [Ancylostoma ceylanicum]
MRLIELLSDLASSHANTVILGDLNLHVDWENFSSLDYSSTALADFFSEIGFRQFVHQPTHGDNILDVVLSSSDKIKNVSLLPPLANADHCIVSFQINALFHETWVYPTPDFLSVDYSRLNHYFSGVDWLSLFDSYVTVDDLYQRFLSVIYEGLARFGSMKLPTAQTLRYPAQIKSLLEQKQRLFNKLENPLSNFLYKKVCSDIDHHLKKFLANLEHRLSSRNSMSRLYRYVHRKIKTRAALPSIKDQDQKECRTDGEKAEALGEYFASVFAPASSHESFRTVGITGPFFSCNNIIFHPDEVAIILKNLKPSSSELYDGIPQIVYRKCASTLSKPLTHLLNLSMYFGEVPNLWKEAIVTAIPKSPTANLVTEFRPISLNPTPIKVMEKIIRNKLLSRLDKFHGIPPEQHGFLPGKSTMTNLVDSLFDWRKARNAGKSLDIIYFDFSKAFDKVPHSALLFKLEHIGVSGKLLDWFRSYLENRHMTVKVGQHFSRKYPCTSGVPQGGALSPLLFLIYTIELPQLLKTSPDVKVQIYADDIKIYSAYDDTNRTNVHSALSLAIQNLTAWTLHWGLPLNPNKCSLLHIGDCETLGYTINGVYLNKCESVLDLGVKNSKTKEDLEEKGMAYHKSVKSFNDQASKIQLVIDELPATIFTAQREIVKFFIQREKYHTTAGGILKEAMEKLEKK